MLWCVHFFVVASVYDWDEHVHDGYKRPKSKVRVGWDGIKHTTVTNVVKELEKQSSSRGYGSAGMLIKFSLCYHTTYFAYINLFLLLKKFLNLLN